MQGPRFLHFTKVSIGVCYGNGPSSVIVQSPGIGWVPLCAHLSHWAPNHAHQASRSPQGGWPSRLCGQWMVADRPWKALLLEAWHQYRQV